MLLFLGVAVIGFVLAGRNLYRAWSKWFARSYHSLKSNVPPWVQFGRSICGSLAAFLISFAVSILPMEPRAPLAFAYVCSLILGLILWIVWFLLGKIFTLFIEADQRLVSNLLRRAVSKTRISIRLIWGRVRSIDWSEVNVGNFQNIVNVGFLQIFLIYFVVVPIAGLVLMVVLGVNLVSNGDVTWKLFLAIIGYNSLLITSMVAIAAIIVTIVGAVCRKLLVFNFRLTVMHGFVRMGGAIGAFSAMGLVCAALSPGVVAIFGDAASNSGSIEAQPISPQILLDFPAVGGALGIVVGMCLFVANLGRRANNVVYRRIMFPAISCTLFIPLIRLGLTPEYLYRKIMRNFSIPDDKYDSLCKSVDIEKVLNSHSAEPWWLMKIMEKCSGAPPVLSPLSSSIVIVILFAIVVIAYLLSDYLKSRQRNRA